MAGLRPCELKFRYFDNNGNPLAGGKVYTYVSGTSTPLITWADAAGAANNTNPVILDSRGEANIFCLPGRSYRFTVTDANDAVIETEDTIVGVSGAPLTVFTAVADGGTIALSANVVSVNTTATTLASVNITVPSTGIVTGDTVKCGSAGAITTLSFSGATVVGAPTTLAAASSFTLVYDSVSASWYRIG